MMKFWSRSSGPMFLRFVDHPMWLFLMVVYHQPSDSMFEMYLSSLVGSLTRCHHVTLGTAGDCALNIIVFRNYCFCFLLSTTKGSIILKFNKQPTEKRLTCTWTDFLTYLIESYYWIKFVGDYSQFEISFSGMSEFRIYCLYLSLHVFKILNREEGQSDNLCNLTPWRWGKK